MEFEETDKHKALIPSTTFEISDGQDDSNLSNQFDSHLNLNQVSSAILVPNTKTGDTHPGKKSVLFLVFVRCPI